MVDSNDVLTFGDIDNFDKTAVSIDIGSDIFAPEEKGVYVKKGNDIYYHDTFSGKEPLKLGTIFNLERIFAVNGYFVTQTLSSIIVWVLSPAGSLVQVGEKISLIETPDIAEAHVEGRTILFSTNDGDVFKLSLPKCF